MRTLSYAHTNVPTRPDPTLLLNSLRVNALDYRRPPIAPDPTLHVQSCVKSVADGRRRKIVPRRVGCFGVRLALGASVFTI